jgi:hypothetical protein
MGMQEYKKQIIKDGQGKSVGVFLVMSDYEHIMERLEELEDIEDYDAAKAENEEKISLREAIELRKKKND